MCEAVDYADRNLVLHRDLKPTNILVTETGAVKLLDFGIAKLLDEVADPGQPITNTRWMTPEYAAPEQLEGGIATTVTDVYALGVILFELLTGRRPFDLTGKSVRAVAETIITDAASRPSTVVAASRQTRRPTLLQDRNAPDIEWLQRRLRDDLDLICLKALRKEPGRRCGSAEQLAADVRMHLAGFPVTAQPDRLGCRAQKFVRRHRTFVFSMASVLFSLILVAVGAVLLWQRAETQKGRVEDQMRVATAGEWMTKDPTKAALVLLEVERPDETAYALAKMHDVLRQSIARYEARHEGAVGTARFSPDGGRFVTASDDGTARVWRTNGTGEPVVLRHEAEVWDAAFSPDGDRILTISTDNTVRLWPADGSSQPLTFRHDGLVRTAAFSPDGRRIVTASWDGTARIWKTDGTRGAPTLRHNGPVRSAAFSPGGERIVTASADGTVRVWLTDGRLLFIFRHSRALWEAAFSPDGLRIVTASSDSTARLWAADGSGDPLVFRHDGAVRAAQFSPDGSRIVTASWDRTARVVRSDGVDEAHTLRHNGPVRAATLVLTARWSPLLPGTALPAYGRPMARMRPSC